MLFFPLDELPSKGKIFYDNGITTPSSKRFEQTYLQLSRVLVGGLQLALSMLSLIIINNHNYYKIKPNIQLSRVLVGGLQLALSILGLIGNTLSIVLLSRCNLIMVVVIRV